jgi:hypothetical protein
MEDKESGLHWAYKKMMSFHPEEFYVSEGGSKPDPAGGNRNGDCGVTLAKNSMECAQGQ